VTEQLKQRIAYLVEHGGVLDDPLRELNRRVTTLQWLVGASLTINVLQAVARVI
jgi:hypothetical protein